MKFTPYFLEMRKRPDRAAIELEWIEATVKYPEFTQLQADGRIRKWRKIKGLRKYLRVILLADGETIHNAFLDRTFKGESK